MIGAAVLPTRPRLIAFRYPCHTCLIQHLCLPCNLDTEQELQLQLQQRLEIRQRPHGGYYTMPMRKGDIALFLKITPETFSRTLNVLRAKGLLDIRSWRFRLPDVAAVRRYVGE